MKYNQYQYIISAITYNYTDGNGCNFSASQDILVFSISYNFVNYNLGTISPKITADSELLIDAKEKGSYHINVYDVNGRTLHSQQINIRPGEQNTGIRPFKNLKRGIYVFTISNNTEIQSEKIYYTP